MPETSRWDSQFEVLATSKEAVALSKRLGTCSWALCGFMGSSLPLLREAQQQALGGHFVRGLREERSREYPNTPAAPASEL